MEREKAEKERLAEMQAKPIVQRNDDDTVSEQSEDEGQENIQPVDETDDFVEPATEETQTPQKEKLQQMEKINQIENEIR